ncbi:helicase associated domain-containing protein [Streptomyces hirsutus]|uniref:Helicase associated domain-containing protein n=1 Tax=Streptomyces hirsutus TaxID=35620 RepID=A0ABZ1GGP9_9ACTN|nr:helicase associated domain-containing protein [Streptomyces hirsutus]WSD04384.1 helicase associated domain-containing protein [Streptomyces hirsutus]WTD22226.1 helicase associated domain-containing protein [Streptomyces hirsutus]WTD72701.1 helicase associated domain-containing protein [Streptomyces sp. NBC_01635]
MPDGTEIKLGIWCSNTKARRRKLTQEQLDTLAELGREGA